MNKKILKICFVVFIFIILEIIGTTNYTFAATKKISINKAKISSIETQQYTGKNIKPKIVVKYKNKELKKNKEFKVSYKNNKKVGKATITIKGIGKYTGTLKKSFYIKPAKPKVTKVCVDNDKAVIKWKKVKYATGYTVYMSNKKNGKYKAIKQIKNAKTLSYTKKGLNNKKEYFFKIKAYYKTKSKKIYSTYSNIRSGGGLLASKVLTATNSPEDRNINLMIASSKINGIILKPNQKFYWSKVVRNANRSTGI